MKAKTLNFFAARLDTEAKSRRRPKREESRFQLQVSETKQTFRCAADRMNWITGHPKRTYLNHNVLLRMRKDHTAMCFCTGSEAAAHGANPYPIRQA